MEALGTGQNLLGGGSMVIENQFLKGV